MDYLQYYKDEFETSVYGCFKPYYKWITFNTHRSKYNEDLYILSFKPYYKWITFNTHK